MQSGENGNRKGKTNMYNPNEARIIRESSHGYDLIPIQDEMLSHREVELAGEVDASETTQEAIMTLAAKYV